jgi:hypothetical protein
MNLRYYLTFFLMLLYSISAFGQWSNDPLQNLAVADTSGEQILPKISATTDGGCFISWFDSRNGNYCVYLQRLNSLGEPQFAHNGLLISSHPQQTWLTDYDMCVDGNDNAIIVFNDIRNGGNSDWDIFAYKIDSDGSFLWGADGIGLSDTTVLDFEVAPKVTATDMNNVVIAWFKSGTLDQIAIQKISSDGQKLWGDYGITLQPGASARLSAPDLVPAADDSVIMIWKSSTGPVWAPTTYMYTQKFDPAGNPAWNPNGVLIYNLGAISAWAYPEIYPDGSSGAFFCWYDAPSLSEFNVWMQHVNGNGQLSFPVNGIQGSIATNALHMYPTLSYLAQTDEIYLFWIEESFNQDMFGIYGQKFSPQGARLWTDSGKQYKALGGNTISFLTSVPADTSVFIAYFESSAPNAFDAAVKAFRIKRNGDLIWDSQLLSSASLGNKDDLLMVLNSENRAFLTWNDDRHNNGDIYAQNINPDGSLGAMPTIISNDIHNVPTKFYLKQNYPNPFNPNTTIEFDLPEASQVSLKVFAVTGEEVATIVSDRLSAGTYKYHWDASRAVGLASGIYIYQLKTGNIIQTKKMILMK